MASPIPPRPPEDGAAAAAAEPAAFSPAERRVLAVVLTTAVTFLLQRYRGGTAAFDQMGLKRWSGGLPYPDLHPHFYWHLASLLLFFGLPLASARIAGIHREELGLGAGNLRDGFRWAALMYAGILPLLVAVAWWVPEFKTYYPLPGAAAFATPGALLAYECSYGLYFFGWEFINRGWMTKGLEPVFGRAAILVSALPFAAMHVGKPELEAYGSLVAGLALGWLTLKSRTIWPGVALHIGVAWTMDALALAMRSRG